MAKKEQKEVGEHVHQWREAVNDGTNKSFCVLCLETSKKKLWETREERVKKNKRVKAEK